MRSSLVRSCLDAARAVCSLDRLILGLVSIRHEFKVDIHSLAGRVRYGTLPGFGV